MPFVSRAGVASVILAAAALAVSFWPVTAAANIAFCLGADTPAFATTVTRNEFAITVTEVAEAKSLTGGAIVFRANNRKAAEAAVSPMSADVVHGLPTVIELSAGKCYNVAMMSRVPRPDGSAEWSCLFTTTAGTFDAVSIFGLLITADKPIRQGSLHVVGEPTTFDPNAPQINCGDPG